MRGERRKEELAARENEELANGGELEIIDIESISRAESRHRYGVNVSRKYGRSTRLSASIVRRK